MCRGNLELFLENSFEGDLYGQETLAEHTSYKIGGAADYFVYPKSVLSLRSLLAFCKSNGTPCLLIGEGANLLVHDEGFRGVVISMARYLKKIKIEGSTATVEGGCLLSDLIIYAEKNALQGVEPLSGVPGTVGGALIMNAGTNTGEISNFLETVTTLNASGEIESLGKEDIRFSYRSAPELQDRVILSARFQFKIYNEARLREFRLNQIKAREEKQPLQYPNCGSVFKRPPGHFVGKMVQDLGLLGYRHNDGQISETHGGFIVNLGNATSADIYYLIRYIQKAVKAKYNVNLEREVRLVGFPENLT